MIRLRAAPIATTLAGAIACSAAGAPAAPLPESQRKSSDARAEKTSESVRDANGTWDATKAMTRKQWE